MKKLRLNKNTKIIAAIIITTFCVLILIKYPDLSAEGIRKGAELCAGTMVPSLFPFLVVSSFFSNSGAVDFLGEKTENFFRRFFSFSGNAGSVFVMGLFSGFPVGCSLAGELYSRNKITSDEAKRIILSSVNAGPAFVIGAVGSMMLSSFRAGCIIFLSLTLSSVFMAFISKYILPSEEKSDAYSPVRPTSLSDALVKSVYSSSKNMLLICSWILLFSSAINIFSGVSENERLADSVRIFAEVSSGCKRIAETKNPAHLAFVIGWSGLCVHCQVLPHVIRAGLKLKYFFCARLFHASFSALICAGLMKIFPCEISVFSSGTQATATLFAAGAPAAAGLLLMCAIFILDLDTHRKMC